MNTNIKDAIIADLEDGLKADIWYDASDYNDKEAAETIEKTQLAMKAAIKILTDKPGG